MTVTVTSKGQVTLPVEARRRLGIRTGTKLELVVRDDRHMEMKRVALGSVRKLKGMLPKPRRTLSVEEMNSVIERGAAT